MVSAPRKLSFQYVRHQQPESLLSFLVRRFRYHSQAEWAERIGSGAVTLNGRLVDAACVLHTRDRIAYVPPLVPEPPVDPRFTILYEDALILAVSKSGNIPTSPSGKYWQNCLRHVLQRELNLPALYAVHRLDRETSGVNLFAKTRDAAASLGDAFSAGRVEKRYAAILRGQLPAAECLIQAPLRDAGAQIHIKQAVHPAGRPSRTLFRLRAVLQCACLVDAEPLTGRTHQIRAHAAFIGLPVWGDRLYGVPESAFLDWIQDPHRDLSKRHLLHAKELRFVHPGDGRVMCVRSDERAMVAEWGSGGSWCG